MRLANGSTDMENERLKTHSEICKCRSFTLKRRIHAEYKKKSRSLQAANIPTSSPFTHSIACLIISTFGGHRPARTNDPISLHQQSYLATDHDMVLFVFCDFDVGPATPIRASDQELLATMLPVHLCL